MRAPPPPNRGGGARGGCPYTSLIIESIACNALGMHRDGWHVLHVDIDALRRGMPRKQKQEQKQEEEQEEEEQEQQEEEQEQEEEEEEEET